MGNRPKREPGVRRTAATLVTQALSGVGPFSAAEMDFLLEKLKGADRALALEISMGTLRNLSSLDAAIEPLLSAPLRRVDPYILNVLRTAAYQFFHLDRVPSYATVFESVEVAREKKGPKTAGFVNAVLRRLSAQKRRSDPAPDAGPATLATGYSHPEWLVERWLETWPSQAVVRWMARSNKPPETFAVAWAKNIALEDAFRAAEDRGCQAAPLFPGLPIVSLSGQREDLAALAAKRVFLLQDPWSAAVPQAVPDRPFRRILDCCAAPGGKTLGLSLRFPESAVIASDISYKRFAWLRESVDVLSAKNIAILVADAGRLPFASASFDLILVDAPCSGTGTLQRNPDLRWKLSPEKINRLARLQGELLEEASRLLSSGGVLAYSTCSAEVEENENVANRFLSLNPGYRVVPPAAVFADWTTPEGYLRTFPFATFGEGFFCAIFERTEEKK